MRFCFADRQAVEAQNPGWRALVSRDVGAGNAFSDVSFGGLSQPGFKCFAAARERLSGVKALQRMKPDLHA